MSMVQIRTKSILSIALRPDVKNGITINEMTQLKTIAIFIIIILLLFSVLECFFQFLPELLAYLVGETVAELWEDLAVEDAPYGAVVECELLPLVLAYAVAPGAVLHVEETDVGHEGDADGA